MIRKLIAHLENNHMIISEKTELGTYFKERWEKTFAYHLTNKQKIAIHMYDDKQGDFVLSGFLWHVFSYRTLNEADYFVGEKAKKVFNQEEKRECYLFFQHRDEALYIQNSKHLTDVDLVDLQDVYVVNPDFTWTYVVTHESDIGPFFYKRKFE